MRRIVLSVMLGLLALGATAQNISFGESIPADAVKVLRPRLEAMLKGAGLADVPLVADATVTDRMETSGSIAQIALTLDLKLASGDVSQVFPLKGVGADDTDAWVRASKQFLPMSQASKDFVQKLKQ